MNLFRFRKNKCEACNKKKLPDDPAKIILDGHTFRVCTECERFMNVLVDKFNAAMDEKHPPIDALEEEYEQSI